MLKRYLKAPIVLLLVILSAGGVFYFELVHKEKLASKAADSLRLIPFEAQDINYLVIEGAGVPAGRLVLQKNSNVWNLVEPIQDLADQDVLKRITEALVTQTSKSLNVENPNLAEFGLTSPLAKWTVKTSKGMSYQVLVGTETNFEGLPFIMKEGAQNIVLGTPIWQSSSTQTTTHFRDKRLYRDPLDQLNQIRIKTLSGEFELLKQADQWKVTGQDAIQLDQAKVNAFLNRFASLSVQEFLGEGEPSPKLIKEKGLDKNYVQLQMISTARNWSIRFQLPAGSANLFAMTERPTQLLKFEPSHWELVANLSVDQFRDRKSAFQFEPSQARKIYVKMNGSEVEILQGEKKDKPQSWMVTKANWANVQSGKEVGNNAIDSFLKELAQAELGYFFDGKPPAKFTGQDMIIIHDGAGQLMLQLNWGPKSNYKHLGVDKQIYLARTQKFNDTFGVDEEFISRVVKLDFLQDEDVKK